MNDDYIELATFHHEDQLEQCLRVLVANNISHKIIKKTLSPTESSLLRGIIDGHVVLVVRNQIILAKSALVEDARSEVASFADEDCYMGTWEDQDIEGILDGPMGWSAFDIAMAERIAEQRDLKTTKVSWAGVDKSQSQQAEAENKELNIGKFTEEEALPEGLHTAPLMIIAAGYFFGLFGGVIALIIGLNLAQATELDEYGRKSYYYDKKTRKHGWCLAIFAQLVIMLWLFFMVNRQILFGGD